MTRGPRPQQALREAKVIAARQGKLCENSTGRGILYDFAIHLALAIIYVRVKRLNREIRILSELETACAPEIRRLREVPVTAGLVRELWVRSPKGTWHFYIVLENEIVLIPRSPCPSTRSPGPSGRMLPARTRRRPVRGSRSGGRSSSAPSPCRRSRGDRRGDDPFPLFWTFREGYVFPEIISS